ncbi:hypothetical protein Cs7R123_47690 [Catellatospora sp. TT07R-123]|uniref:hypothetical protein n=1 Tax=Catellatospora sp. TT07R-123 TaxID=2733863 RepID=UPI001B06E80F|nr:hypothetical protein [Catellatospora sp. TT07R-123]GHJ47427.1 hypothetical protein Cs7R123_47690 [Catellatospora sp. TT07R-123]
MRAPRIIEVAGVVVTTALLAFAVAQTWPGARPTAAAPGAVTPSFTEPDTPQGKRAFRELCPIVNRPEVLAIVEDPPQVRGMGTSYGDSYLICTVSLQQSAVRIEVGTEVTVSQMKRLSPKDRSLTVQGRPALLEYGTVPMHTATLLVARDAADTGAYFSIVAITPETPVDEAAMVRIAELVLPRLPAA